MKNLCCEAVIPGSSSKNCIVSLIFISLIFLKAYVFVSPGVTNYAPELSILLLIIYLVNLSMKVSREKNIDIRSKETILALMIPGLDLLFSGKKKVGIFVVITWVLISSVDQFASILFTAGYLLIYRRIFESRKLTIVFLAYSLLVEIPITYIETVKNQEIKVISRSMEPTIKVNNHYLVKVTDKIGIGDIGAFKPSDVFPAIFIKRIVGMEGDRILLKENVLYVNGKTINDVVYSERGGLIPGEEIVIPKNSVYVLGDNSEDSYDSREFGVIDRKYLYGKIIKNLDRLED